MCERKRIVRKGIAYVSEGIARVVTKELGRRGVPYSQHPEGPMDGETGRWGNVGVDETVQGIQVDTSKSQLLRSLIVKVVG